MTEVVQDGSESLQRVGVVDLKELSIGDHVVVTTKDSIYDFEVADGTQHSVGSFETTDFLVIKSFRDKLTQEELGLTHGNHYRSPYIIFLGSRPLDRDVSILNDLDHHKIQRGASFLVLMDGEEHNGQHVHSFEFSPVDIIELHRQPV